ncbi:hypothetical protein [Nocardia brevicatena]|uniref:hypothetical protein n=1 Tax=Nocardia brevicatena TaxID=37327 RepID=UPI0002F24D43|nr:hypothetical protein [Nocardia brevicatena]
MTAASVGTDDLLTDLASGFGLENLDPFRDVQPDQPPLTAERSQRRQCNVELTRVQLQTAIAQGATSALLTAEEGHLPGVLIDSIRSWDEEFLSSAIQIQQAVVDAMTTERTLWWVCNFVPDSAGIVDPTARWAARYSWELRTDRLCPQL